MRKFVFNYHRKHSIATYKLEEKKKFEDFNLSFNLKKNKNVQKN